jgi:nitrate/nitrite transporter NarK
MTGFISSNFWLSYSMQKIHHWSAISVALHMLPQVLAGILWNICAANMLHRVNNGFIMAFGSVAYVVAAVLVSLQDEGSSYWAFSFPSLVINVIGADFQFNVVNVGGTLAPLCELEQSCVPELLYTNCC